MNSLGEALRTSPSPSRQAWPVSAGLFGCTTSANGISFGKPVVAMLTHAEYAYAFEGAQRKPSSPAGTQTVCGHLTITRRVDAFLNRCADIAEKTARL